MALSHDPTCTLALKQRAISYQQANDLEKARRDIDSALQIERPYTSSVLVFFDTDAFLVISALDPQLISLDQNWRSPDREILSVN